MSKKPEKLCDQFEQILGGSHTFENGACIVMRARNNIRPRLLGERARSFLLLPQMFAFESLASDGRALCSGCSRGFSGTRIELILTMIFNFTIISY
ncbi:DUF1259 domain-containing protein [Bacillus sp. DNRA2]|nr:DUF1259 domain-containing protein [Bacillus sp. DNRA2]